MAFDDADGQQPGAIHRHARDPRNSPRTGCQRRVRSVAEPGGDCRMVCSVGEDSRMPVSLGSSPAERPLLPVAAGPRHTVGRTGRIRPIPPATAPPITAPREGCPRPRSPRRYSSGTRWQPLSEPAPPRPEAPSDDIAPSRPGAPEEPFENGQQTDDETGHRASHVVPGRWAPSVILSRASHILLSAGRASRWICPRCGWSHTQTTARTWC